MSFELIVDGKFMVGFNFILTHKYPLKYLFLSLFKYLQPKTLYVKSFQYCGS